MKADLLCLLFVALLFLSNCNNLQGEQNNSTEYKTYLVKTKLTKEELQTLLKQSETEVINLKKKNKTKKTEVEVEELNSTNLTDGSLQEKIEKEIQEDALHPIDEFHKNEVKTLVTKPNPRFLDSLYEKRFGKFYAYLTLLLFVFVMIYYKDSIFNQKKMDLKKPYLNNCDNYNEKEYMLVKNN